MEPETEEFIELFAKVSLVQNRFVHSLVRDVDALQKAKHEGDITISRLRKLLSKWEVEEDKLEPVIRFRVEVCIPLCVWETCPNQKEVVRSEFEMATSECIEKLFEVKA